MPFIFIDVHNAEKLSIEVNSIIQCSDDHRWKSIVTSNRLVKVLQINLMKERKKKETF